MHINLVLLFLLSLVGFPAFGQDINTHYFDETGKQITSGKNSFYYTKTVKIDSSNTVSKSYYTENDRLKLIRHSLNDKHHGIDSSFFKNGQLHYIATFNQQKLEGRVISYWENGKINRDEMYENDKYVSGKQFNSDGTEITKMRTEFIVYPEFPGGVSEMMRFIVTNTRYPNSERIKGTEGQVYINFTINTLGEICNVTVKKSVSPKLDAAAIKVVNLMPKWKPGLTDGRLETYTFNLPFNFQFR